MALLPEVHPITRSIVNTQRTDPLSHTSHVVGQAVGEAEDTRRNGGFGAPVFQGVLPFLKGCCLLYLSIVYCSLKTTHCQLFHGLSARWFFFAAIRWSSWP